MEIPTWARNLALFAALASCPPLNSALPTKIEKRREFSAGRSGSSRTAVLLIDMQEFTADGTDWLKYSPGTVYTNPWWQDEIEEQIKVLEYAQQQNIPVMVVKYVGNGGKGLGEVVPELQPALQGNRVHTFAKTTDDAFESTTLEQHLHSQRIDELIIMGFHREGCVYQTARTAVEKGFRVLTPLSTLAEHVQSELWSREERRRFYEERTSVYHTADELVRELELATP